MQKKKCSVIILSGGKSERMNFPKPYLLIDGITFIEKIIDEYLSSQIDEIVVVLNHQFCDGEWKKYLNKIFSKVKLVKNSNPDFGKFYSLKLGINKIINNDFCYIQNVDNPFINKKLIEKLWENKNLDGYVSPTFEGKGGHPVLISKKIIQHINNIENGDYNLKSILNLFLRKDVEMKDDCVLRNINTPEEYRTFVQHKMSE